MERLFYIIKLFKPQYSKICRTHISSNKLKIRGAIAYHIIVRNFALPLGCNLETAAYILKLHFDTHHGPTARRRFLILTRLYKSTCALPESWLNITFVFVAYTLYNSIYRCFFCRLQWIVIRWISPEISHKTLLWTQKNAVVWNSGR